jgi:hypothetical protein
MVEEVCSKMAVKKTQIYRWHKGFYGPKTVGLFCTLVVGQKVSSQTQCDGFGASLIFPGLFITQFSLVSMTEKCSERNAE